MKIVLAKNQQEISDALKVRKRVFILEQGIDENIVCDSNDNKSDHILAYINSKPVGSLRVRYPKKNIAKIERMAVLKEMRGQKIGYKMMGFILEYLKGKDIKKITLDAQAYIKAFYEKFGFIKIGDEFDEVGIPHIKMEKSL